MKNYAAFIILSLLFINTTFANNWTGSSYTSALKQSALANEKGNATAAVEQYLELANYYQLINDDSVKYFLAKSLSVALLSNDDNLMAISWIKHKEYIGSKGNASSLANAKQYITTKTGALLKCLIQLIENEDAISQALLDKTDKLLIATEKDIEKGNETNKFIFLLLQEERANAGFSMNSGYQYPSDIAIGLKIAKAKGYMNAYMTLLISKAMMLSANANYSEALKLNYEYKEQAKKLDNIVYYQASLIHLAHAAYESKKYEVVENECNELINLALSAKHKSKSYSRNKFTEAHNLLFMTYCEQEKYDKALYYIEKCIYYSDSLAKLHFTDDSLMAIGARLNLGALYYELGQHQKAADQFLGLIKKYDTDLDYVTKATLNTNIGECYVSLGQYAKALKYLNLCQPVIQELGVSTMATFYRSKREAFKGLRQYDSAYVYYSLYQMAHDSVYNLEKQQALADITEKYDNDKLLTKNNFLEDEAEMNKTKERLYLLLIGFGVVIVIAGLIVL